MWKLFQALFFNQFVQHDSVRLTRLRAVTRSPATLTWSTAKDVVKMVLLIWAGFYTYGRVDAEIATFGLPEFLSFIATVSAAVFSLGVLIMLWTMVWSLVSMALVTLCTFLFPRKFHEKFVEGVNAILEFTKQPPVQTGKKTLNG